MIIPYISGLLRMVNLIEREQKNGLEIEDSSRRPTIRAKSRDSHMGMTIASVKLIGGSDVVSGTLR
jgi:hypothetical protein